MTPIVGYHSVSIREELWKRIQRIKGTLGYSGTAAYVSEALRMKINADEYRYEAELERLLKEEQRSVDLSDATEKISDN